MISLFESKGIIFCPIVLVFTANLLYNPSMSERSPEFRRRFEYVNRPSFLESCFINTDEFRKETHLNPSELIRVSYSSRENSFRPVSNHEPLRSVESLLHPETATLVVPPPKPGPITPDDLATMALPVVKFIKEQQPDIVAGCDRGARLYAVAVYSLWDKALTKKGEMFPTLDHCLRYARLSTSLGLDITSKALAYIWNKSADRAKQNRKGLNSQRPKWMFIDDWVCSGKTRQQILDSFERLGVLDKVDTCFAVMCGGGADVSGSKRMVDVAWHDRPEVIGVNYTDLGEPFCIYSERARTIRRKIHKATRLLAKSAL